MSVSFPLPGMRVASTKRIVPPTGVQARPVATPGLGGPLDALVVLPRRSEEGAHVVLVADDHRLRPCPPAKRTATPRDDARELLLEGPDARLAGVAVDDDRAAPRR